MLMFLLLEKISSAKDLFNEMLSNGIKPTKKKLFSRALHKRDVDKAAHWLIETKP